MRKFRLWTDNEMYVQTKLRDLPDNDVVLIQLSTAPNETQGAMALRLPKTGDTEKAVRLHFFRFTDENVLCNNIVHIAELLYDLVVFTTQSSKLYIPDDLPVELETELCQWFRNTGKGMFEFSYRGKVDSRLLPLWDTSAAPVEEYKRGKEDLTAFDANTDIEVIYLYDGNRKKILGHVVLDTAWKRVVEINAKGECAIRSSEWARILKMRMDLLNIEDRKVWESFKITK